jgi:MFS superfamily sulfate permease-like transporter
MTQLRFRPSSSLVAGVELAVGVWLLQSALRDGLREGWSRFLVFILVVSLMLVASAAIGLFVALRRHRMTDRPR